MQDQSPITVYVTLLPTGTSGGGVDFTAVLTPALPASNALPTLFQNWPASSANLGTGAWKLYVTQNSQTVEKDCNPVSPPPDGTLWKALIDASMKVNRRAGSGAFNNAWLLSHDADHLNDRHLKYRTYDVIKRLAQIIAPDDQITPAAAQQNMSATAPVNVYLFPIVQQGQPPPVTMQQLITDHNIAVAFLGQIADANVLRRIAHGRKRLEQNEGEKLTGLALMALYRHCACSLLWSQNATGQTQLNNLISSIDTIANQLAQAQPDPTLYGEIQKYVEFHLFRHRDSDTCNATTPDFHQLLGLLNQYPALLRRLALAFDFTAVTPSPSVLSANSAVVALVSPPSIAGITFQPLQTACTSISEFIAATRGTAPNTAYTGRFLRLTPGAYSLITEDTDGSSHKLTNQAAAKDRVSEYQPRPIHGDSGLGTPDPTTSVPSARTTGIGLFSKQRTTDVANALTNTPGDGSPPPNPLYLEDITLGYRADVQNITGQTPGPWMSLHERASNYEIHGYGRFTPIGTELLVDQEGYLTLGGTQSPVDSTRDSTDPQLQVQVHQALLAWTGWSLSVPLPKKGNPVNSSKSRPPCPPGPTLNLKARYKLKPHAELPKLRFGERYALRLRHVDLAGNSPPLATATPDGADLKMTQPFSRIEPVRAPQILLERPIHSQSQPSEHVDRMVLRDGSGQTTRILVPPREPLQMAVLHGFAESRSMPPSAFPDHQLTSQGSFPTVAFAQEQGWIQTTLSKVDAENQDALFLRRQPDTELPKNRFYPDPLARYVRIEPFVLQEDLFTYLPWCQDSDVTQSGACNSPGAGPGFYLDFLPSQPWPFVSGVRIRVQGVGMNQPLRIRQDMLPEDENNFGLPSLPTLTVELPAAWTVALRLTSANCIEPGIAPPGSSPSPQRSTLPPGARVNLFYSFLNTLTATPPQLPLPIPPPTALSLKQILPDTFVCGRLHPVTPPRILTLVHAVKRPLTAPDFSGDTEGSDFKVVRASGANAATVTTKFKAHWLSTAKITCHAAWTDTIDDISKAAPQPRRSREVAFEFLNAGNADAGSKSTPVSRNVSAQHQFRDTRAHSVEYTLSAFTRFSEFYPENPASNAAAFSRDGKRACHVVVCSSVRPPTPSVVYVIPAFAWEDAWNATTKTWMRGRRIVLRVYLERPFLVSGDQECLGVVLSAGDLTAKAPVSTWGTDPIVPTSLPLQTNLMQQSDFGPGVFTQNCQLQEGGTANILAFPVDFCKTRALWYCDIPMNASQTPSAFARVALVRWQPQAITTGDDARLSQVVLADFMQIGPDRWVCIKKIDAKNYSVTISGVFRTPNVDRQTHTESMEHTISCSIEQRWHRLGQDMGWRPVCPGPPFVYQAPQPGSNIACWSATVKLPHSSTFYKFRLLLEEHEWLLADVSKDNTSPVQTTPTSRTTYLHHIEL